MYKLIFHQYCALFVGILFSAMTFAGKLGTPDLEDIEYPDDEPPNVAEVELGKTLFFDPRLSVNQRQSCASCHDPNLGFGDGLKVSLGTMGKAVNRNAPHLYNLAWNTIFFWDGRASSLEHQALGPIEAAGEMNMLLPQLITRLQKVRYYRETFKEVYGESGITDDNIARAIAAFERTIISRNSPYDRYVAGNKSALQPAAIRGLALFEDKARCTKCHDGSNFTDESFHNIGVAGTDPGRYQYVNDKTLLGAFKTPGLRNVALTAPYMHDGSQATLEEVIRFYNRGGDNKSNLSSLIKPLNLSEQEISDLVTFLGALTDPVVINLPSIPE